MKGHFNAYTGFTILSCLFISLDLTARSIASPLSSLDSALSLATPPPRLTFLNSTSEPKFGEAWPDGPFAKPMVTADPHAHCQLAFRKVGTRPGTKEESNFFLIQVLEAIINLQAQPTESIPIAFDVDRCDVRFKMEIVPQHPMNLNEALAALQVIYILVVDSEVREFTAVVDCQGLALGRFRVWLADEGNEKKRALLRKIRACSSRV